MKISDVEHSIPHTNEQSLSHKKQTPMTQDERSDQSDLFHVVNEMRQPHEYHYRKPSDTRLKAASHPMGNVPGTFRRIPREILEQPFVCSRQFGLLPEIQRVWITVDNTLYLWNYGNPKADYEIYDGMDQLIVSVGLVKPKRGVFDRQNVKHSSTIKYVLVLATTVEIVLLTVSYKGIDATGKIEIRSSGFSVPSDDISMHHIEGTPSGRIFMGGRDGNLYELHYQRGQGLMQVIGLHRNCWITSHTRYLLPEIVPRSIRSKLSSVGESTCLTFDRDRQIVYLLVEEDSSSAMCGAVRGAITRSVIHAFYLGKDGTRSRRLSRTPLAAMEEARRWAVSRRKTQLASIFTLRNTNSKRQLDEQMVVRGVRALHSSAKRENFNVFTFSLKNITRKSRAKLITTKPIGT